MKRNGLYRPLDQFLEMFEGIRNAIYGDAAQPDWPINPQNSLETPDAQFLEIFRQIRVALESIGGSGGLSNHAALSNRNIADQHPISAITGLAAALFGALQKVAGNSEFFNETDGGGLVFKDNDGREVAGICLNGNCPQLYVHRYTNDVLSSRVLVETHEDGLYISTVLSGANWIKISDTDEVNALIASAIGDIERFGFAGPYDTTDDIVNPDNQHIYLIGAATPYTEYCYINGAFEEIGTTEIDLTNYYTKSEADDAISNGTALKATKLQTARNIAFTGAVTGNANFDGSANISIATALVINGWTTLNASANASITYTFSQADYQRPRSILFVYTSGDEYNAVGGVLLVITKRPSVATAVVLGGTVNYSISGNVITFTGAGTTYQRGTTVMYCRSE
jgi:hypothetical protein